MMILLAIFAFSYAIQPDSLLSQRFEEWKLKYQRQYSQAEEGQRFENFKVSLTRIDRLNRNSKHATFALNKFSDMSPEEFSKTHKMPKIKAQALANSCLAKGVEAPKYTPEEIKAVPDSWDWRDHGLVTPVKDQGSCGSCWAFSTIANIEGQWAKKGKLESFSEQLLVDCSKGCSDQPPYGPVCNQGCGGGWQWNAFSDVMAWGGVEEESKYPYTGEDGSCKKDTKLLLSPIKNYTCLSGPNPADEAQLQAYIYKNGPVSMALDATLLQDYFGGIVDPFFPNWECNPMELDHALLIVGWGHEPNWIGTDTPYWIVKNSWGSDWGDSGYFLIIRNLNMCGLANAVSSAIM